MFALQMKIRKSAFQGGQTKVKYRTLRAVLAQTPQALSPSEPNLHYGEGMLANSRGTSAVKGMIL